MGHRGLLRATALAFLSALFVKQGTCNEPTCDFKQYYSSYSTAVGNLHFKVPGSNTPAQLKEDCDGLKNVAPSTDKLVFKGCDPDKQRILETLQSGLQLLQESLCNQGLEEGLTYWKDCFKPVILAECQKKVQEQMKELETFDLLSDHEASCRNMSKRYLCELEAGAGCPDKAEVAKKAVENYIYVYLDFMGCPRPTGCDRQLFLACYEDALKPMLSRHSDYLLDEKSLAGDCKVAKSVSICTRNLEIEQCPEEVKKHLRTVEGGFRSVRDSLCNEQLPASTSEWNQCLNREVLMNCDRKVEEMSKDLKANGNVKPHCREREERLKCALSAMRSCPPSASLAKKAVLDLDLSFFDVEDCPRPNLQGSDGDSSFSNTPKIFVTLAALLVALFPMKQTLLRQLS